MAGPETYTVPWWLALYEGTPFLGAAALPVTLLWLRSDQRTAALVAITLFGLWSAYFIAREPVDPQLDSDASVWRVELVTVVLTLLARWEAQAGQARPDVTHCARVARRRPGGRRGAGSASRSPSGSRIGSPDPTGGPAGSGE